MKHFEAIYQHSADGILIARPDGLVLSANPAALRMLGYTEADLQRLGRSGLLVPEPHVAALIAEREARGVARGEVKFRRADGSVMAAEVTSVIVPGSDGGRYTYIMFRDVSDHHRTQEAVRRTTRALMTLGKCNEALVRAGDEQALFQEVCRTIVEEGGYRMCWAGLAEHDERRTIRPVASAGHDEGYVAAIDVVWADGDRGRGPTGRAVRSRKPVIGIDFLTDPTLADWREAALARGYRSAAALPLVAEDACLGILTIYAGEPDAFSEGEVRFLVQLAEDLAFGVAARRARAERDRLTAQLVQADRLVAMGTLAAGVAHEINNPLAYAVAGLEHLGDLLRASPEGLSAGATREALGVLAEVREGAERVRLIVRDLKAFSRGEEATTERAPLAPILDMAVELARSELRHRARVVKAYGPAPAVRVNQAKLGQVFLNLLVNAAQAIAPGRAEENEVRVSCSTDAQGRAVVEVRDTGAGVLPELADRLFEPFVTGKRPGEGTGLGLSICRSVVTGFGGEISFEAAAGGGTTFRVTLPPAPAEPARAPASSAPPAPSVLQHPPAPAAPAARRGRVAVVDDEPGVRRAIGRALGGAHEVTLFERAREVADRLAAGERFDVILCDLMMPDMTGMELHRRLLAEAPDQAAALVFMTGGAFAPEAREFLDAVPNERVEKPFDTPALRALVRSRVG